jgi:hypothetical protein
MIAEESSSEAPGGEPPRPTERDLLAERRARRAALSGDMALVHRAEVAEATVQTLETHLASLQQRLQEAEAERRDGIERLAASENELRRVKQQEYAEQQLRVEAERALAAATDRRLSELRSAGRPADVAAGSEALKRLQARVTEVERRAAQLAQEIETERRAHERTVRALDAMRESHATMAATVRELRDVARKLRDGAADYADGRSSDLQSAGGQPGVPAPVPSDPAEPFGQDPSSQARREEMADALAAAVERLRARADESPSQPLPPPREPAEASLAAEAAVLDAVPTGRPKPQSHKHSMSLIGRWRYVRKHRRESR